MKRQYAIGAMVTMALSTSACATEPTNMLIANRSGAPHADTTATDIKGSQFGWRFVDLENTFGTDTTLDGLSVKNGTLQLFVRRDQVTQGGVTFLHKQYRAAYDPMTDRISDKTSTKQVPSDYVGPVKLSFPTTFPTHFQTQSVRVEENGKLLAAWPKSIPLYGSAANPQTDAPGSLDNRIIGQTGSWIWVALKGPQYPPLYPKEGPMLFAFRQWNRLVALNTQTGQVVQYTIPPVYSLYQSEAATDGIAYPAFATDGKHVYVAVGSWIGVFPGNPDVRGSSRIIKGPSQAYVNDQASQAMADLRRREAQAANHLAAYWDSVIGVHVPGLPRYTDGQMAATWTTDPVIFNHGAFPSDIVWAEEFPLPNGGRNAVARSSLETAMMAMLTSKLNADALGMVPQTYAQVRASFHHQPPMDLPGYQIQNGAYIPRNSAVLNAGVAPLPKQYSTYQQIQNTVGELLYQRSPINVLLPKNIHLSLAKGEAFDVKYEVAGGTVGNGYDLTVSVGAPAAANAKTIVGGMANTLFSILGQPKGATIPPAWQWGAPTVIPDAKLTKVTLGSGIVGTLEVGAVHGVIEKRLVWQQDGIAWSMGPSPTSVDPVANAAPIVKRLVGKSFDGTGTGVFAYGAGSPSEVVLQTYGAQYVVDAPGWRADEIAASLQ